LTAHLENTDLTADAETAAVCGVPEMCDSGVVVVDIESLLPGDSPRLAGHDQEHVRRLADADVELPPIIVHRRTMRVIDGMHRLRAAALRGARQIRVTFFDGTSDAAFLVAVRANVSHGLPLSRADREAAAWRIIESFPELSDRAVAMSSGLSGKAVATIRRRSATLVRQPDVRTGLDGRTRPVNSGEGRRAAEEVIKARPEASLREIARQAGISPNTARDVRARLRRGEDPLPPRQRSSPENAARPTSVADRRLGPTAGSNAGRDLDGALQNMKRDPSLRFTEAGRRLLRWLDSHTADFEEWQDLVQVIPPYHVNSVAVLARECAQVWQAFAEELDNRGNRMRDSQRMPDDKRAWPHRQDN
jgi:ParB-like chromosome segregation protein Spo0J